MSPNQPKTPTTTIRLPAELKAAVRLKAEVEGLTLTDVVVRALTEYLRENPAR